VYRSSILALLSASLFWTPHGAAQQPTARADHVVLISIDGFRPEFYLDERWPAPTLQQMAREGVHAKAVRGIFPTVTFPAHTTLVTGALPARHGIHHNAPFEPTGQTGRWYWEAEAIRAPTLWEAVRQSGGSSAAVLWPVTRGAAIEWNLPDIGIGENAIVPLAAATTPAGLIGEIEREATGRLGRHSLQGMAQLDHSGAMAAHLLERYRPKLLLVHLIATDHFQHQQGREGPLVRRAVAAADRAVGRIREAAERAGIAGRTAFIVTGDHGFVDVQTQVNPNVWLSAAGLMEARPDRGRWLATFHGGGGSTFLHLNPLRRRQATVDQVRALLERLPAGERRLFRIVERAELDRVGADPAAALALAARPGVTFGDAAGGSALRPASGGAHGYFPDLPEIHTGLIGWGAGFRAGAVTPLLGQEDVAPLVAALLALPFRAPDGVLHPGLLTTAEK
jgi:predicted AlkP superfamily pyrophosphatase or phosphodiesterase